LPKYMVMDGLRPVDFTGMLLAAKTTRSSGRPRWTELALYRMADDDQQARSSPGGESAYEYPSGAYMLTSLGGSVVYHRASGGCEKGRRCETGLVASLDLDAVACEDCWPRKWRWPAEGDDPLDLLPGDSCRPERNRPKAVVCAGAEDVEGVLRDWSGSRKVRASRLSGPAQDLLEEAARADEAIRQLITEEVHL